MDAYTATGLSRDARIFPDGFVAEQALGKQGGHIPDGVRFFNEARAVNRVDHPGLVQISDYGKLEDGTGYIVMEYLKGETLGQRYRRMSGHLPASEVLQLMRQIASALAAAHDRHIIHCDLKPDNVMIVPDPETPGGERAKLLDFGIAKLAGENPSPATGAPVGTPMYMSPEQCRGAVDLDGKSDVYSLGIMLYQLLVGQWPFPEAGLSDIMAQHLNQEPIPLKQRASWVPDSLNELAQSLLQKDPHARPAMKSVVTRLGLLLTQSDKIVRPGLNPSSANSDSFAQESTANTIDSSGMHTMDASAMSMPRPAVQVYVTPSNQHLVPDSTEAPTVGFKPSAVQAKLNSEPGLKSGGVDTTGRAAAAELSSRSATSHPLASAEKSTDASLTSDSVAPRQQQSRRRIELIGAVLVVSVIGLALGGRFLGHPKPDSPPPALGIAPAANQGALTPTPTDLSVAATAVAAVASEPALRPIRWSIQSVPPGAEIIRTEDSELLGRTPWQAQRAAKTGSVTLRLRLPGYVEQRLTLDTSADFEQSVTLQRKKTERLPRHNPEQNPLPIMD